MSVSTIDTIESQKLLVLEPATPVVVVESEQPQPLPLIVEYESCSRCPKTAAFEDTETHTVYCSDECRDDARRPEHNVVCLVTRDLLCEMAESSEKVLYSSSNGTLECTLLQLSPPYLGELTFNEDGSLAFPDEHEPPIQYHAQQCCVLRVEQGKGQIDVFDCAKQLRASYHLCSARRDQCIIPHATSYTIRNTHFDMTLKLSRTLIKQ